MIFNYTASFFFQESGLAGSGALGDSGCLICLRRWSRECGGRFFDGRRVELSRQLSFSREIQRCSITAGRLSSISISDMSLDGVTVTSDIFTDRLTNETFCNYAKFTNKTTTQKRTRFSFIYFRFVAARNDEMHPFSLAAVFNR